MLIGCAEPGQILVKIAYFIAAHHKPYQLEWLMKAIYNERDVFLLHVDFKSSLGLKPERRGITKLVQELASRPNIIRLPSRYANWGGWSLSALTLAAINELLRLSADWTHFVNLSGQCYPAASMASIRERLSSAGDRQFVQLKTFSELEDDDWHLRRALAIETPLRAFALSVRRRPPKKFLLEHTGAQWVILTRDFCDWQRTAPISKHIRRYLSFSHLSDELIIQTLIRNGPYFDKVMDHYGRAIIWPGPKVLTAQDEVFILRPEHLFARKFDATIDSNILCSLARQGGYQVSRAVGQGA